MGELKLHISINVLPTEEENEARKSLLDRVKRAVAQNHTIRLQDGFLGTVGVFCYQFEGEDDLLHLAVTRRDKSALTPEEGQDVAAWLLPGMPSGLIWIRPGEFSQHFYCGHDDLVAHVREDS